MPGDASRQAADREFWKGMARGFGGALLFSLPILLTMETWHIGFYAGHWRLLQYVGLTIPLILALSYIAGMRENRNVSEALLDGLTAYAIGIVTAVVVLSGIRVITLAMPLHEIVGKVGVQAPTSALGAVLARELLAEGRSQGEEERKQRSGYWGELFLVSAGAFYLASTVASTEEILLIAYSMTGWHATAVAAISIIVMHAFLYTMKFAGAPTVPEGTPSWSIFLRYTLPGYLVVLLMCAWILWTFERFESESPRWVASYVVTLGLPGAVGGAAGRLIV